ncbi:MAG: TolC family protein [Bdellovibrionales bacterium]|nr:TolC family protein [Bdellovibrionales bacterium]
MNSPFIKAVVFVLLLLTAQFSYALSLDEYLKQVNGANQGQIGAERQAEAANLKASEADLLFMPQFFTEARMASEGKKMNPPLLVFDRIETSSVSAGLAQQFSFGLQGKLYYSLSETKYVNSPMLTGSTAHFYDTNPTLELSMPLWGNGFGRTSRAQKSLILSGNQAEQYGAKALSKGYEIEAENTYWSLVARQEILSTQEKALQQAEGILSYVSKKAQMRLGEDSDVLQAKALVAARQLELRKAKSDEQSARRNFNIMRNSLSDEVPDKLDSIPYEVLQSLTLPGKKPSDRYDVKAAEAQTEAAVANSKIIDERNKPTLDVYGAYTFNGRGDSYSDSNSKLYGGDRGTQVIGLRLNIPLDFSASSNARAGARLSETAQKDQLSYKQLTQEKDWNMMTQQLQDAKESLALANKLVSAQTAKLNREKSQLRQGRATTYQVLLFEQDQSQAEIIHTQIASQILALRSGLKAYQHSGEEK